LPQALPAQEVPTARGVAEPTPAPVDYDALAQQHGAIRGESVPVDYDALAKSHGALSSGEATETTPKVDLERAGTITEGKSTIPPSTSAVAPLAPAERAPAIPEIDRRQNLVERRRVAEMSPEEMKRELLTSPTVDLPNRRAFNEAEHQPAKAVAMSDADGLKAFNDKFGYEAGNALLRAKADALKAAGLDAPITTRATNFFIAVLPQETCNLS